MSTHALGNVQLVTVQEVEAMLDEVQYEAIKQSLILELKES